MKKILLVTDFFRPEPGGLEGFFTSLARNWESEKIEVLVTSKSSHYLNNREALIQFDRKERFPISRVQVLPTTGIIEKVKNRKVFEEYAGTVLDDLRPDHILFGNLSSSFKPMLRVAGSRGIPYSIFINGMNIPELSLFRPMNRKRLLQARSIFTLSRFMGREVHNRGVPPEKIVTLPPAFESRWGRHIGGKESPELRLRTHGKAVLLGVGPLVPRKGFDQAVEMIHHMGKLGDRIHLILAGSGPEFPYLKELIELRGLGDRVTMTGFLSDEDLGILYTRADLLVEPGAHRHEDLNNLSTSLMEAAWFGLPVVSGRIGGAEELVEHGSNGHLVEPGNIAQLAESVRHILASPELKRSMSRSSRNLARTEFDIKRVCRAIDLRL